MWRPSTAAAFLLAALLPVVAWAEVSTGGPLATLQQIRVVFLSGEYEDVVSLTNRLLESEPSMLIRTEGLQYLGASLELLGRTEEAEEQFEVLLTLQPLFHMNQADFPTEVVSLFESMRLLVRDRLDQIEEQRRRVQDVARRERERRLLEQQERLIEAARPRYLVREAVAQHLVVALLPFGAGQFQNGQRGRGYAFFGTQLGLTAASMVVWLLGTVVPDRSVDQVDRWQIASYAVYGSLGVCVAWGIIDALVNYRRLQRRGDRWQEVRDRDVPEEHRIEVDPELLRLDETLGTGWVVPHSSSDVGPAASSPAHSHDSPEE